MSRKCVRRVFYLLTVAVAVSVLAQEDVPLPLPHRVEVITPDNAAAIAVLTSMSGDTRHISISPDSRLIAFVTQHQDWDYNISIFNMQTGTEVSRMQGRMDTFRDLIWSPDGMRIAVIRAYPNNGYTERHEHNQDQTRTRGNAQ